jgi:hypothetical protein
MDRKRAKRVVSDNVALSMVRTLIAVVLLTFIWVTPASSGNSSDKIIDGEFVIQPYELPVDLPDEQYGKYRHMTAISNEEKNELILFGGITYNPGGWPPPSNDRVYTLDLTQSSSEQEWEEQSKDFVVDREWFTTARGFLEINNKYYLTCDDRDDDVIYTFDPVTYEFEGLTTFGSEDDDVHAADCCAVGVTISNSRNGNQNKEERIYIIGGRNNTGAVKSVRYYSITKDKWERVSDLEVARHHPGCATVEQKGEPLIYVIAGGNSPENKVFRSIEVYNVIEDEWTTYDGFFPQGEGRSRLGAVQNIDNKYLLIIGGDATCAGGPGSICDPDQPVTWVDMIDIKNNRLISDDNLIPQLKVSRQTPATSLIKRKGNKHHQDKYEVYVIGGQTRNDGSSLDCTICHNPDSRNPIPDNSTHNDAQVPQDCITSCHTSHLDDDPGFLELLGTTEVLSFDGINVQNIDKWIHLNSEIR